MIIEITPQHSNIMKSGLQDVKLEPADSRKDTSVCRESDVTTPDEDVTERRGKRPLATK